VSSLFSLAFSPFHFFAFSLSRLFAFSPFRFSAVPTRYGRIIVSPATGARSLRRRPRLVIPPYPVYNFSKSAIAEKQKVRFDMTLPTTVQVRQRGTLTLPADIRERYHIRPGDSYHLVDLDGVLVLTPLAPLVPELAREIERARLEAGLSIEELLEDLRAQRERYTAEKFGAEE